MTQEFVFRSFYIFLLIDHLITHNSLERFQNTIFRFCTTRTDYSRNLYYGGMLRMANEHKWTQKIHWEWKVVDDNYCYLRTLLRVWILPWKKKSIKNYSVVTKSGTKWNLLDEKRRVQRILPKELKGNWKAPLNRTNKWVTNLEHEIDLKKKGIMMVNNEVIGMELKWNFTRKNIKCIWKLIKYNRKIYEIVMQLREKI